MWKGRFAQATADLVQQYGESISYDWRLYKHDIAGSIAHARAQLKAGLLTEDEFNQIETGLREIEKDIDAGNFKFSIELEDIHMNIESELTNRIGAAGGKLHTARSRNDQVATDTRLYCREQVDVISEHITALQLSLLKKAEQYSSAVIPGYTHLQRGQPVTVGHHLLAYVEMFARDLDRLKDARKRINVSPLGSGALAGSTINLDREQIATELGFDSITTNSMDAISDRDYIMELLFDFALVGTHLSRLSEDLILWCSSEFSFATLSDAHTTGSSLMPQKKNPDAAELVRGKVGRVTGSLVGLLTVMKGLPLTYSKDMQEDKEGVFDAAETLELCLAAMNGMIADMTVNNESMKAAAGSGFSTATDLADWLVREADLPFREAHHITGRAVALAEERGCDLAELELADLQGINGAITDAVYSVLTVEASVGSRTSFGGTAPSSVLAQIEDWRGKLQSA